MGKIWASFGLSKRHPITCNSAFCKSSSSVFQLKTLKKDTISFSGSKKTETDPYKNINSTADQYYKKLCESVQTGLEYLQSQVKGLKANFVEMKSGIAGLARIVDSDKFPGYTYEMDINTEAKSSFEAALHEGYHILQFAMDKEAPFVKTQKELISSLPEDAQLRKEYTFIIESLSKEIVLPYFSRKKHEIIKHIENSLSKNDTTNINKINAIGLFEKQESILPEGLTSYFRDLPSTKHVEFAKSQAEIEIKAHQYCLRKNSKAIIEPRQNINLDKIRDLIAIKIYSELVTMANSEIQARQQNNSQKVA